MASTLFLLFLLFTFQIFSLAAGGSFTIDYGKDTFMKDGKPFRYISGTIHYSRVPSYYWADRLAKAKAAGLNAIQTLVPWNFHEVAPGHYDFTGDRDLERFLRICQQNDLLVILRPGPYICAEWEYGGFPAWIKARNATMTLRSSQPAYLAQVGTWFNVLLPKLKPLLYINGGPIITVQIENEYGSYFTCDRNYISHLINVTRKHLGDEVVLFTTDGAGDSYLRCGAHPDAYTTVDFGPGNAKAGFKHQRDYQKHGPLVNSEYYTGWLDIWGKPHSTTSTDAIIKTLQDMLDMGANVNMYVFEGGTNFAYTNGADPPFRTQPTSYDYDAPLTEAGDVTKKYQAIRTLLKKYSNVAPVPPSTPKAAYGPVQLHLVGSVQTILQMLAPRGPIRATYPLTMEQVKHYHGYTLYRHLLSSSCTSALLNLNIVRDAAYVTLDGVFAGMVNRSGIQMLTVNARRGQTLDILVENQGRINYGRAMEHNLKGLIGNVTLDGAVLANWEIYPLNMTNACSWSPKKTRQRGSAAGPINVPAIYQGTFEISGQPMDTYLNTDTWSKGQVFVNSHNLGRYWPVKGPQVTLYVPKGVLKSGANHVHLFELQNAPCGEATYHSNHVTKVNKPNNCSIRFTTQPIINGTTYKHKKVLT